MAEKKLSIGEIIFWLIIGLCLLSVLGCASQTSREDSTHYVAQLQDYPCPRCGFSIPDKDVSTNIGVKNICPNCRAVFFGKPVVKKTRGNEGKQADSDGLKSHGPRSVYESDTNYQYFWVGGESFKETETGYSFLLWSFSDRKVKIRRVKPRWTTTRYRYR